MCFTILLNMRSVIFISKGANSLEQ